MNISLNTLRNPPRFAAKVVVMPFIPHENGISLEEALRLDKQTSAEFKTVLASMEDSFNANLQPNVKLEFHPHVLDWKTQPEPTKRRDMAFISKPTGKWHEIYQEPEQSREAFTQYVAEEALRLYPKAIDPVAKGAVPAEGDPGISKTRAVPSEPIAKPITEAHHRPPKRGFIAHRPSSGRIQSN